MPVVDDRHSQCKGNNRPIDALQQGRIVLTNPGIPSYDDLYDFMFIGNFYETYKLMIDNPKIVIDRIKMAQNLIDQQYTPAAYKNGSKFMKLLAVTTYNNKLYKEYVIDLKALIIGISLYGLQ